MTENRGSSTAAEVVVVAATPEDGDRLVEQSETTLDYIARKSSRGAGVFLKRNPAPATLEIMATSYRKP